MRRIVCATLFILVACDEPVPDPTAPKVAAAGDAFIATQITAGANHACAIAPGGAAYCWGRNDLGQLGIGPPPGGNQVPHRANPQPVFGGLAFKQLSAGTDFTCGITTANRAWCWGVGESGRLGNFSIINRYQPFEVQFASFDSFASVSTGEDHACAVTPDGRGYCWGRGTEGAIGNGRNQGTEQVSIVSPPPFLKFRQISAGYRHSCGIVLTGQAYCWGMNDSGQVGDGTIGNSRFYPVPVAGGMFFTNISARKRFTCGTVLDGNRLRTYCWGVSRNVGKPDSLYGVTPLPFLTVGGQDADGLASGAPGEFACAARLASAQVVSLSICWGQGNSGQLGNDGRQYWTFATPVNTIAPIFDEISTGGVFACGRASARLRTGKWNSTAPEGSVWCWGDNQYQQVGYLGPLTATPRQVTK